MRPFHTAALVVAAAVLLTQTAYTRAQPAEHFAAIAANISNVGASGLVPMDIHITRWTTDEEHQHLFETLGKKGQDAFLDELLDQKPAGWAATPTSLRYDFFYARQDRKAEGGRRIMMITDRPMLIAERMTASPSREYPFTVIEMHLDENDEGRGTLAQLVQLRLVGNILGIDNLASSPVRLNEIRKVK